MNRIAVCLVALTALTALAAEPTVTSQKSLLDLPTAAPREGVAAEAGRFNLGAAAEDGLALSLDLGTRIQNWNRHAVSVCEFAQPLDLSKADGIRVAVSTAKPRIDASVTVWLREADGSWYYAKGAVPLAAAANAAVLTWADFVEAEWVSPGQHVDEDYVFDRSQISHVGIGVVNSLGVGVVEFTVTALEQVTLDTPAASPARVAITGKTLEVNGHRLVPAGIFGGYATTLDAKFRPGTQRHLMGPGGGPNIAGSPLLSGGEIADWAALQQVIEAPQTPAQKHVASLVTAQMAQDKANKRKFRRKFDDLRSALNDVLQRKEFYSAEAFAKAALDERARALLAEAGKGELSLRNRALLNRLLLAAAVPGQVAPLPTEKFIIDCWGDRFVPSPILTDPNWKDSAIAYSQRYAEAGRRWDARTCVEIWNEPYLNWARPSDPRNYKPQYYDLSQATIGGKVQVKYKDGTLGPVVPHFRWAMDGDKWKVEDTTQFTYWSGKGNGWLYDEYARVVAKTLKEADPDMLVLAGWGFRWQEDHWKAWEMLYKPTIDATIEWIDGLCEHHYQGDTTAMNGAYEVATAYAKTRHGKWLYSCNTETTDLVDAPARGAVDTPEKAKRATEYRRMTYNLRDLVYCVAQSPDKILGRTVIHPQHTPTAMDVSYGLLADLRGRLVKATSSDDRVWAVSSLDGTDPEAMPADGRLRYVVVVFNDHRTPRDVEVTIEAPTGCTFDGPAEVQRTVFDRETFEIARKVEPVEVKPGAAAFSFTLAERSAWKFSVPLKGTPAAKSEVVRTQAFSSDILQAVEPGKAFETTVAIDEALLKAAAAASLRLVIEDTAAGEAVVEVAGKSYALPKAVTADNVNRIVEIPVPVADLAPATKITFRVAGQGHSGYRVDMTSIVLETN